MAVKSLVLDDNESYIIEDVVSHEIIGNKLNLTIKWYGYIKPALTGMNASLKKNEKVQEYLKANGLNRYGLRDSNESIEPAKKRVRFSASTKESAKKRVRFSTSATD